MKTTFRLYTKCLTTGKIYENITTLDKQYATDWCKEWNEGSQGKYLKADYDVEIQTYDYDS